MFIWKKNVVISLLALLLFSVLALTISNSVYTCEVDSEDSVGTCYDNGIRQNQSQICHGTVFIISGGSSTKTMLILCSWNDATVSFTFFGIVAALIYILIVLVQRLRGEFLSLKFVSMTGLCIFPILLISTILMFTQISDGGQICKDFEAEFTKYGNEVSCSNGVFGTTFFMSLVGMLIFGYEALQGYHRYKYRSNDNEGEFYKEIESTSTNLSGRDLRTFYVHDADE